MVRATRFVISGFCFGAAASLLLTADFTDRGRHFEVPQAHAKFDRAGTYDLAKARMLTKVVGHVRSHYVDPKRIEPKEMAVAAMRAVQSYVPEVMVGVKRDKRHKPVALKVSVDDKQKEFGLERVGDLYELNWKLMNIFDFLERQLPGTLDLEEVEYAAVNGLLSTLDPHSVLLPPRIYREMQVDTQGKFGGLGIVVSIRKGTLTVMSVMGDTPADRAGLESGDKIVQIGEESTVNMPLNDAVNRLRGEPGTEIVIWIRREGMAEPKKYTIVREEIRVRSVVHESLDGGVGYVRIRNFQSNTYEDLNRALEELAKGADGLKGLVLDLRENPGGLLDQAIDVSNRFLSRGTIVTTVREGSREREPRHATEGGTLTDIPIVVLINRGSASASEIVAGAIKHNDRGIVLGTTSFGKGSVQVIYKLDEAALKLTVAQYLTPGDVSIQSVGIVPDIELVRSAVSKDRVDLMAAELADRGEVNLKSHLDSRRTREFKPSVVLRLMEVEGKDSAKDGKGAASDAKDDDEDEDGKESRDPVVQLAAELLRAAPDADRKKALVQAAGFLERRQQKESQVLFDELSKLGVDWTAAPTGKKAYLSAELKVVGADGKEKPAAIAGDEVRLVGTVRNEGKQAAYRIHGVVESTISAFDGRELVFGLVEPGATREWSVPIELPRSMSTQGDELKLRLYADYEPVEGSAVTPVKVTALPQPLFGYAAQIEDPRGNGDGLLQRGESFDLVLDVTNQGAGAAEEVLVTIKNESGEDVFIEAGRDKLGALAVGESKTARFSVKVRDSLKTRDIQLKVAIVDQGLRTWLHDDLRLPIFPDEMPRAKPADGVVQLGSVAQSIYAGAHRDSGRLGTAAPGSHLEVRGQAGDWLKVAWTEAEPEGKAEERVGWVPKSDVAASEQVGDSDGAVTPTLRLRQPEIRVGGALDTLLVTDASSVRLDGLVRFADGAAKERRAVYVFRGEEKVFFRSAHATPDTPGELAYDTNIALEPGENQITVYAREGEESTSHRTITIYRR